jgi:hypothetical protein
VRKRRGAAVIAFLGCISALVVFCFAARIGISQNPVAALQASGLRQEKSLVLAVAGNTAWTDTGLDVVSGEVISFEAEGKISLQKGNPEAECGPDGYDLQTNQQPIANRNLGSLIGKVVIAVTVTVDEKTKQEKKQEAAELFYVGSKSRVEMPAKGRLFLGINENVIGDNAGEFRVTILGPPSGARSG